MFSNTPLSFFLKQRGKASRAFTLVELLVVISIIVVLMGLLFPVAGSVMRSAKKTQAKNDALQIASAIKGYYTEYGRFPIDSASNDETMTDSEDLGYLYKILLASPKNDDDVQEYNPRLIVFLDAKDAKNGRGGIDDDYVFLDPWGQPYQIVIDANYDNEIPSLPSPFSIDRPLRDTVAVFSPGDPEEKKDEEKRAVTTWQ